jgi:predicted glycosyltransferase
MALARKEKLVDISHQLSKTGDGPSGGYRGTGVGLRALIYSHDTFGLGHLRRCLKISQALKITYPDLAILIVTGSPQVHRYSLPAGVDYVKLPAVRKTADEQYEPRHMGTTFERVLNMRSHILLDTVKEFRPHILLVDHSPLGMKGELLPALEWIKMNSTETEVILGLRDIIDDPARVVELWRRQGVYEALSEYYDHILIYGSKSVFDPVLLYEFPSDIANKAFFCGYISETASGHANGNGVKSGRARKFVLVTIGGGDGAGEAVIGTFLNMLAKHRDSIEYDSLLITGPFVSEEQWRSFRLKARGLPTTIRKFVNQTRPYLLKSDLVISTGGYNTTTEILTFAKRALVIPRIMYRNEQLLRAERLRDMGLLTLMHPDDATPDSLHGAIENQISCEHEPLAAARGDGRIQLDGAARLASYFGGLFTGMTE